MRVFFPANGGFPTIASNPSRPPPKTSGNSTSQWNGRRGSCIESSLSIRTPSLIASRAEESPSSAGPIGGRKLNSLFLSLCLPGAVFVGLEKCGNATVTGESDQVERGISLPQVLRFPTRQERIGSPDDFLTFRGSYSNHLV